MRVRPVSILRYTAPVAIIAFGVWYIAGHYDLRSLGSSFTPKGLAILAALNLLTILCESIRLHLMIRKLGTSGSGLLEAWNLMTLIQALNLVMLKAGTVSGGYYLFKRRGIAFSSYLAFVVTYVVVIVLASGVLGLVISCVYFICGLPVNPVAPIFFSGAAVLSAGTILAARSRLPVERFPEALRRFFESIRTVYSDTGLLVVMTGLECVFHLAAALRFTTAIGMLSGHVGLLDSALVMTVGNFLKIATVVPGGLGIAEVASAWTADFLGGDAGISGLSAAMDRIVYVVLVFLFGGIGFLSLANRGDFHAPAETETMPFGK